MAGWCIQNTFDFSVFAEVQSVLRCPQTWTVERLAEFRSFVVDLLERLDWIQEVDSVEEKWDYLLVQQQKQVSLPYCVVWLLAELNSVVGSYQLEQASDCLLRVMFKLPILLKLRIASECGGGVGGCQKFS